MEKGLEPFRIDLQAHKTTKGMLQIPYTEPLPEDLIRRIAQRRVQDVRRSKGDGFW
jgi:uncharacterized protein YdhG (YjbR/CyaY superfamily)